MVSLSQYLLDVLEGRGVRTIFGLPGDYILDFFKEIEKREHLRLIPLSTEAGVGFAAEAHARSGNGLGVACVTYGVGALSMVNQVACAWAEMTPLVVISGGPGVSEKSNRGLLLHHQVKDFTSQKRIYEEVTEYAVILDDPATAAAEIQRVLNCCEERLRPVYLEIPRDMVNQEIQALASDEPFLLPVDEKATDEAVSEITACVAEASSPLLLIGIEVHRRQLREKAVQLAEKWNLPVASTFLARGTFPLDHPNYLGTYLGDASEPGVQEAVEGSDRLLMLGVLITDTGMAAHLKRIDPERIVQCIGREVIIRHHKYENVPLDRVLEKMIRQKLKIQDGPILRRKGPIPFRPMKLNGRPIRIAEVINILNHFLLTEKQMLVVADTGDCLMASYELKAQRVLAPAYYATMGFAIPSALGAQIGAGERPIVLVGDGAFQMSCAELAHCARHKINPIVIVLNNGEWGMLEAFSKAGFNQIVNWPYAKMAELWGGNGFLAGTPLEFNRALRKAYASKKFSLIEVPLRKGDITETLKTFVRRIKC